MIKVVFRRLERSKLATDLVLERIQPIENKFPDLLDHKITVTLSMENAPLQVGPDVFKVKAFIDGRRYKSISIEKAAASVFVALADVIEHTLERLNRYGDKVRVKSRKIKKEINYDI